MNHARNNVLAGSALSLDEDRNIRACQFCETVADGLHGLRAPEDDRIGRHFSQRLDERAYTAGGH